MPRVPDHPLPGLVVRYKVRMPAANHKLLPGHRIMVQVQSSWFPQYERNPQSFVPNTAMAKPAEFSNATQQAWPTPDQASFVQLLGVSTLS